MLVKKPLQRLFLIGSMGAGKTTVGQLLAQRLDLSFFDSDKEIEQRCGASISWIFDKEGEEQFRDREAAILKELAKQPSCVVATGGGAILREENQALLRRAGTVIYLFISVNDQLQRLELDTKRPLLQQGDKQQVLEKLFEIRDPLYRNCADVVVEVGREDPRQLMLRIVDQLTVDRLL